MKKLIVALAVIAAACITYAGPHGCHGPCGPGGWCRPCGPCHPCGPGWGHHPHHSWWGRGGCNFWPGFVGGVVGGAILGAAVAPTPVVVAQPVVSTPVVSQPIVVQQPVVVQQPTTVVAAPVAQTQNVWVEGRYIDQVQSNGTVVRVWQPGHYEQRSVLVQ